MSNTVSNRVKVIPVADHREAARSARIAAVAGGPETLATPPRDTRGRPLHDLRISVTDRCNFRCTYCMPREVFGSHYKFLPQGELLTFEEITRVARAFVDAGVNKIRLTGGEPLLRKNLERLVEMLARLPVDLTLTTNGVLLARKARALRDAGLSRMTVSLDALDDPTFQAMSDCDFAVADVLAGIDAAAAAGLAPIKVNAVIRRGVNEHAIVPLARHFKGSGHIMRFIEYMDVGSTNGWRMDDVVPAREIVAAIDREMPLVAVDPNYTGEVAKRWRHADGSGEIGVIASVTQAFCHDCTRARLSTDGKVYTCLFATQGDDLRARLRGGATDDDIARVVRAIWSQRSDRYSELRGVAVRDSHKVEMSYIGG
jgi:cyclic pyranopterin phosphate synthase